MTCWLILRWVSSASPPNPTNDNIYLSRTFSAERTDRCDRAGRLISTTWRCRQRLGCGDEAIMALSIASPAVQEGTCGFWRRGRAAIIVLYVFSCFQVSDQTDADGGVAHGRGCRAWVVAVRTSGWMAGVEDDGWFIGLVAVCPP